MKLLALALALPLALADKYAVLIAGSNSYANYRHQADVAHAYNILTAGGVKAENIITMMYDDIAGHITNKFKGQIFNRPDGATASPDVYAAVKDHIDYRKGEVTPSNFIKVLTGEMPPTHGSVWKHPNMRFAYVAQHAFHHLEAHLEKTPVEYILWRYSGGYDKELAAQDTLKFSEEEEAQMKKKITVLTPLDGEKKWVVERICSRRKTKTTMTTMTTMNERSPSFSAHFDEQRPSKTLLLSKSAIGCADR